MESDPPGFSAFGSQGFAYICDVPSKPEGFTEEWRGTMSRAGDAPAPAPGPTLVWSEIKSPPRPDTPFLSYPLAFFP